jgi:catechol 2,3-dioxygenase-like lactoylglutathione lyase family enzyme
MHLGFAKANDSRRRGTGSGRAYEAMQDLPCILGRLFNRGLPVEVTDPGGHEKGGTSMSIRDIAIVSIPVEDPERSRTFFTDQLGFVVVRDTPMGPDQRWIQVAPPNASTSLTLVTWFPNMKPGGIGGIVLETDDIDATVSDAQKRGLEMGPMQEAPWGRFVTFDDPDGNGFVIQQTAAGI